MDHASRPHESGLAGLLSVPEISRRRFVQSVMALGAAGGGTALLEACGGSSTPSGSSSGSPGNYTGPKVELAFWNGWTGGTQPKILVRMLDEFNKDHSNISVQNNTQQWADLLQKAPAAVKAGQGPDVGVMHGDDVATFAAQGLIEQVDDLIKTLNYSRGDFPPTIFDAVKYNNQTYAVPFSVTPLGHFFNKTALQQAGLNPDAPPKDDQEYTQQLQQLKAKGIQGSWVDPFTFTGVLQFQTLLWQFGGELYNKDVTKATFNSDAGVQALTWMVNLIKQGFSPANVGQDANFIALQNGKTAFNWNGVWQTSTLAAISGLQWGASPVPKVGSKQVAWSSSTHFVVYKKKGQSSNAADAAKTFINWFIQHSNEWAEGGELPAKNSVRTTAVQKYAFMAPFAQELDYAHFETAAPGISDATSQLNTAISDAVLLRKSPKDALNDSAQKATQQLQQNAQQYKGG
jgi:multiple sugar transport system substrate-binding protein